MAATKKTTAVAKPKVQLPADFQDRKAADLAAFKSRLATPETNKINVTQDKKFKLPSPTGDIIKVDKVAGIIVDFAAHKRYYEFGYDKDDTMPPNCYAVGFVAHDNLTASDNSPEPQNVNADTGESPCRGCARNKWEKDAKGGWIKPDCQSRYELVVLAADGEGKLMTLGISSTGTKAFDKYLSELASSGKAPYEVITEFTFDPKVDYASVRCEMVGEVEDDVLVVALNNRDDATRMAEREPNVDEFAAKVAVKRLPSKARGKKAA